MANRIFIPVVVVVALIYGAVTLPLRYDRGAIDPLTGSLKYQTSISVFSSTRIEKSALQQWVEEHNPIYEPKWQHLHTTTKTIFGASLVRACASAPPIYELQTGEWNTEFVRRSSDQELTDFMNSMEYGREAECRKLVDAAIEKATAGN